MDRPHRFHAITIEIAASRTNIPSPHSLNIPHHHPKTFDFAILGGGFARIYAARALTKALRQAGHPASVALIAEENHMVYQPMLPNVAGDTLSPRHVVSPTRRLCPNATVFKASATALDVLPSLSIIQNIPTVGLTPFGQVAKAISPTNRHSRR